MLTRRERVMPKVTWLCHCSTRNGRAKVPLMSAANVSSIHYKLLILLFVVPFTRERRQVQFLNRQPKKPLKIEHF